MQAPNLKSSTAIKDNNRTTQLETIFLFLFENVATASMVAKATGVPHKNICRFKKDLELSNRLWEIERKPCELTGFKAYYLSTNPKLKPSTYNQLSLFDDFKGGVND